jgi:ribosomal protein S18 acetylase RimI-like enzyme
VAVTIRPARPDDDLFLSQVLVQAAFWRPGRAPATVQTVLADPVLAHYIAGWPRTGDLGFVAETTRPVGAAWIRHFSAGDPGFGFVDDATPELTIGVLADHRGQGVGRQLLDRLLLEARTVGLDRISLSVEQDNHVARRLYERVGFEEVAASGNALTMVVRLRGASG